MPYGEKEERGENNGGTRLTPWLRRRTLIASETKRQHKHKVLASAAAGGRLLRQPHLAFDRVAHMPTVRMTELTATHHRTPVVYISLRFNWQSPILVSQMPDGQLVGLVTRGLPVFVLPRAEPRPLRSRGA